MESLLSHLMPKKGNPPERRGVARGGGGGSSWQLVGVVAVGRGCN